VPPPHVDRTQLAVRARAEATDAHGSTRAWRLKQRRAATGEVEPRKQRYGRLAGWVVHADRIRAAVNAAPDATLAEYRQRFRIPLSKSALARALVHLGFTRKKSRSGPPSRIART